VSCSLSGPYKLEPRMALFLRKAFTERPRYPSSVSLSDTTRLIVVGAIGLQETSCDNDKKYFSSAYANLKVELAEVDSRSLTGEAYFSRPKPPVQCKPVSCIQEQRLDAPETPKTKGIIIK